MRVTCFYCALFLVVVVVVDGWVDGWTDDKQPTIVSRRCDDDDMYILYVDDAMKTEKRADIIFVLLLSVHSCSIVFLLHHHTHHTKT